MSTAITVRQVSASDLPVLRSLDTTPDDAAADRHFDEQRSGDVVFFVALEAESPLGVAVLDLRPDDYCPRLRNMWVYPHARRKGAGRALSTHAEQIARERGHTEVFLAVDPNNEAAVPLYVSLDYYPIGEHIFVEQPEEAQVADPSMASDYYAVYRKSLVERH